jgi:WhiB family redox-sensing transcriptional regulator
MAATLTPDAPNLPDAIGRQPEWMQDANCRGVDPALFYPERGEMTRHAKAVCAQCPVRVECLDHALATAERFGVWGGTSERERRRLRRVRAAAS